MGGVGEGWVGGGVDLCDGGCGGGGGRVNYSLPIPFLTSSLPTVPLSLSPSLLDRAHIPVHIEEAPCQEPVLKELMHTVRGTRTALCPIHTWRSVHYSHISTEECPDRRFVTLPHAGHIQSTQSL